MELERFLQVWEGFAPLSLAQPWDPVGVALAPARPRRLRRILLAIDWSLPVVQEACARRAQLVLVYHPPIFKGLTRLVGATAQERALAQAVQWRLAVFSPHTALDALDGGVNDWLCEALGPAEVTAITPSPRARSPKEGAGRIVRFPEPKGIEQVLRQVKAHLGGAYLRVTQHPRERTVSSVAVCAGSGASVLNGQRADIYLTGEMSHHEVLAAMGRGTTVLLTEHFVSERGYLVRLATQLERLYAGQLEVLVSQSELAPLSLW